MRLGRKLPLIRIQDTVINLDNLVHAWINDEQSYTNHFVVSYHMHNDETDYEFVFKTRKAASEALDKILEAVTLPIIDEED